MKEDTSIRENSNRFGMDDLSLFVFKSVHSQAVLISPGGEVLKLQRHCRPSHSWADWKEKDIYKKEKN